MRADRDERRLDEAEAEAAIVTVVLLLNPCLPFFSLCLSVYLEFASSGKGNPLGITSYLPRFSIIQSIETQILTSQCMLLISYEEYSVDLVSDVCFRAFLKVGYVD